MDENKVSLEKLLEKITGLVRSGIELGILKTLYKLTDLISALIPRFVILIINVILLLFLSLGVALWLDERLDSSYLGFFVVTFFYVIVAFVLFLMRNLLKKRISDFIISRLFK